MGNAQVFRTFAAAGDDVWRLMSWRGMEQMAGKGVFAAVAFADERDDAGAIKHITMNSGATVCERLEWVDEVAHAYGYRILDTGGLPIANYEATVRVTGIGPDACAAVISCQFVALESSDADYAELWIGMEKELLEQIASLVEDVSPL